jgi:hypothetical protein
MRNTIRNVRIVVDVLITSCHVSLNRYTGPRTAHNTTRVTAIANAIGRPDIRAVQSATRVNIDFDRVEDIAHSLRRTDAGPSVGVMLV